MPRSWKRFAEKNVDVIRNFIPVCKARNDIGRRNQAAPTQCKDSLRTKHTK